MTLELVIDGGRFRDYDGFVAELNRAYVAAFGGTPWNGEDFNDLDDFLNAPAERLSIRWTECRKSAAELGYDAMAACWSQSLSRCRAAFPDVPSLHQDYQAKLDDAVAGRGPTLFDWLVIQLSPENVDLTLE